MSVLLLSVDDDDEGQKETKSLQYLYRPKTKTSPNITITEELGILHLIEWIAKPSYFDWLYDHGYFHRSLVTLKLTEMIIIFNDSSTVRYTSLQRIKKKIYN